MYVVVVVVAELFCKIYLDCSSCRRCAHVVHPTVKRMRYKFVTENHKPTTHTTDVNTAKVLDQTKPHDGYVIFKAH